MGKVNTEELQVLDSISIVLQFMKEEPERLTLISFFNKLKNMFLNKDKVQREDKIYTR